MSEENNVKNKMGIWDRNYKTDPKHTKKVNIGRGFTAIDPYYQIQCATKEFGAAGDGWGWIILEHGIIEETKQVIILIQVWYEHEGRRCEGIPQWGQCKIYTDNAQKKPDNDCMKKATTDAITKCLSYLGFNADIFMGKFDDNKYIQDMDNEFRAKDKKQEQQETEAAVDEASELIKAMDMMSTVDGLKSYWESNKLGIDKLSPEGTKAAQAAYVSKLKAIKETTTD